MNHKALLVSLVRRSDVLFDMREELDEPEDFVKREELSDELLFLDVQIHATKLNIDYLKTKEKK
jgi:hypothetical protein